MKILIIGGNVEALVANYILAERGHSPLMVVERSKTQNLFTQGPWRPVGVSPLLMEILGDLDMDFSDYQAEFAAAGVDDEPGILSLESAIEREVQTVKLTRHPEFRWMVAGRNARELSFDRQAFFDELAATASLDTQALHVDSVSFSGNTVHLILGWGGPLVTFDLAIVTASPRVWDPGFVVSDLTVTEIEQAPSSLRPFDLVELGGADRFEALTWRNGTALVETSGHGLPEIGDLVRLIGGEPDTTEREVASFETTGPRFKIGSSVRLRREIGNVETLPSYAYALGRTATGEPQTLSQVADTVAAIIGNL